MGQASEFRNLDPRDRRRLLRRGLVRPVATVALCGVGYFVLPWTSVDGISTVMLLVGGLLVVLAVAVWQIRQILRSDVPTVQAIETLALILPVYLFGYAVGYSLMSQSSPTYFSEPLSRMDALYFSLTVFSTVGFGDITATTDPSRAVVSVQIIGNLILIGVGIRVVAAAVVWARGRK
ncbi:ion channel family protein [Rhodococcus erythropolis]|nr:ion channel family protein [Rhodococcus erythropolis]REK75409.1 two pore domain potassium channel family protein [Rhodococcus erythropolis]